MDRALDIAVVGLRRTVTPIDESASALAGALEQVTGPAGQMATSAQAASGRSQDVPAAAEQISRSVDTVSTGSEQMGASIRDLPERQRGLAGRCGGSQRRRGHVGHHE